VKKRMRQAEQVMQEGIVPPMFDDALPERLVSVGATGEPRRLQLHVGTGAVSPYIVKLRDEPVATGDMSSEIAALAESLIIDDDDVLSRSLDGEDVDDELSVDLPELLSQLREFDTAVPEVTLSSKSIRTRDELEAPLLSLDEALAALDAPIAMTPLASISGVPEASPIASLAIAAHEEDVFETVEPIATETSAVLLPAAYSPWVHSDEPVIRVKRTSWYYHPTFRAFAAFLGLSFALVLPLQAMQTFGTTTQSADALTAIGRSAIDDLARGAASLREERFDLAKEDFGRAAEKFSDAEQTLGDLHTAVVGTRPGNCGTRAFGNGSHYERCCNRHC